ncbi:collagen alpha-1(I) chain-like [Vombatus ursinus]|uniref:collagen alpha-1(I) chain-like n=1 Tax=Vombatus ursinus TaxID=29139 RepID=UPI000FFD8278|nr:collagen alpha-1(I) chain-like [Vombatus ursinus]
MGLEFSKVMPVAGKLRRVLSKCKGSRVQRPGKSSPGRGTSSPPRGSSLGALSRKACSPSEACCLGSAVWAGPPVLPLLMRNLRPRGVKRLAPGPAARRGDARAACTLQEPPPPRAADPEAGALSRCTAAPRHPVRGIPPRGPQGETWAPKGAPYGGRPAPSAGLQAGAAGSRADPELGLRPAERRPPRGRRSGSGAGAGEGSITVSLPARPSPGSGARRERDLPAGLPSPGPAQRHIATSGRESEARGTGGRRCEGAAGRPRHGGTEGRARRRSDASAPPSGSPRRLDRQGPEAEAGRGQAEGPGKPGTRQSFLRSRGAQMATHPLLGTAAPDADFRTLDPVAAPAPPASLLSLPRPLPAWARSPFPRPRPSPVGRPWAVPLTLQVLSFLMARLLSRLSSHPTLRRGPFLPPPLCLRSSYFVLREPLLTRNARPSCAAERWLGARRNQHTPSECRSRGVGTLLAVGTYRKLEALVLVPGHRGEVKEDVRLEAPSPILQG